MNKVNKTTNDFVKQAGFACYMSHSADNILYTYKCFHFQTCRRAEVRQVFPFSICHSFSFLFFFFCWWCGMRLGRTECVRERKASHWIWVAAVTKACFPGLLFCVQSANRQPEIISHNSPLQKQETLESPDDCERAYDTERQRRGVGGLCCHSARLCTCSRCSLALWGHLWAFCFIVNHCFTEVKENFLS